MIEGFDGRPVYNGRTFSAKNTSPFDKMCALRFMEECQPTVEITKYRILSNSKPFKELRLLDSIPSALIEQVLDYHLAHHKDPYHPKIPRTKTFRRKFDTLLNCMEKAQARIKGSAIPKKFKPSKEAKMIESNLLDLGWPKGSADLLIFEIQASLDYFQTVRQCVKNIPAKSQADRLILDKFASCFTINQIEVYYQKLHGSLVHWHEWSGQLQPFRPTLNQPKFAAQVLGVLCEFTLTKVAHQKFEWITNHINENLKT